MTNFVDYKWVMLGNIPNNNRDVRSTPLTPYLLHSLNGFKYVIVLFSTVSLRCQIRYLVMWYNGHGMSVTNRL